MSYGTSNPVRYFGQQARRAAGWTLAEFGQRIGYDPGQISRIENGRGPPPRPFAPRTGAAGPRPRAGVGAGGSPTGAGGSASSTPSPAPGSPPRRGSAAGSSTSSRPRPCASGNSAS